MPSDLPEHDTTAFLDEFRTGQLSHLLVAAVTEFDLGTVLAEGPLEFTELCEALRLQERAAIVLLTAMRAIGLIDVHADGCIGLTAYGTEKLSPHSPFHLRGYIGLGGFSADVQNMIACLRDNKPAGDVSFVYHEDKANSALDDDEIANVLTRAMADRARNVAPELAQKLDLSAAEYLVDVGGAHGLYSLELLKKNPALQAVVIDREPPLKVAREYSAAAGLAERLHTVFANAHSATLERAPDVVLLANLLHDYNVEDAQQLVRHYAAMLAPGARMLVLDSMLNSVPPNAPPISDGPRAIAAYSALLFSICEGRCYRLDEIQSWLTDAGLQVDRQTISLSAHGTVVTGWKPS